MKKIFLILFAPLLMALQCEEDPIYEYIYIRFKIILVMI